MHAFVRVLACFAALTAPALAQNYPAKNVRMVVGFAAGEIPRIPLNLLLLKGCEAVGVFWGESVKRDPAGHRASMVQVLDWVAAGKLVPHMHATYPLESIADAVRVLDQRAATGKVVVTL
ncbi:zinc-binding dehydrogenase [bacterium]|nr:zinc-binding dehydrogenase [bacterium]